MMSTFLALVGSPRPKSTSEKLGRYLADGLAARGWTTGVQRIGPALRQPERWTALETAARAADVIALCQPLYVDSLPSEVTLALERLAEQPFAAGAKIMSVLNCGFLEAEQNDIAIDISRLFARDAGLHWAGGLSIGGGGGLADMPFTPENRMIGHIVNALDQTVESLAAGGDVPEAAQTLIRRRFCPTWMYIALANVSMMKAAFDQGALFRLNARPYAK